MKKLLIPIAAIVCASALSSARAQNATTNVVTFSATTYGQNTNDDNGTTTTYGPIIKQSHTLTGSTGLLHELGNATGNSFTTAAKLLLIVPNTNGTPVFAVVDGAKFVYVSNIMSFSLSEDVKIKAGKQTDNADAPRSTTQMQLATLYYNDTNLIFSLTGLSTIAQSDTTPVGGTYTDTIKASVASMTGEGTSGGDPFVATGSLTITGGGKLTVP